ncbi:hypothetical protein SAMN04489735_1002168 [Aneurinibacillus thermoaerophilus]|uniref:Uncharacterized protein n=1 Tax=Aneurinibacillus thermoaerophilus TaxID=143495 RepID=A0A1G7WW53_ANETH|nr:hypothetical protein SAMN04489735_1002168 [Aneurinibacillus thermoaerophilus]
MKQEDRGIFNRGLFYRIINNLIKTNIATIRYSIKN